MLPERTKDWMRLGTQTWPFGQRSCSNLGKRPPLPTASVDQGNANRDGFPCFPLSLSLEPNGHIGASCHCHPLSIRSGLAPSSQLRETQTPLRFGCPNPTEVWLRAARFSEGTGPFASHPANGVQNVQVLVCSDALWVRQTGAKTRKVRRSHLSGPAV